MSSFKLTPIFTTFLLGSIFLQMANSEMTPFFLYKMDQVKENTGTSSEKCNSKDCKKLKVLVLHGLPQNPEYLNYQLDQGMRPVFDQVIDFDTVAAPLEVPDIWADPVLTCLGIPPPYYGWSDLEIIDE